VYVYFLLPFGFLSIQGTPCQDYSRAGSRNGLFSGTRFSIIWSWIQIMLLVQPALIIHENVIGFPTSILQLLFHDCYWVYILRVDAEDSGFNLVSRPRIYVIMYHKLKTRVICSPQHTYGIMKGAIEWSNIAVSDISACFLATQEELLEEISELALQLRVPLSIAIANPSLLLSAGEQQRLEAYINLHIQMFGFHPVLDRSCIFNLADNPLMRCSWSAHSKRLPCYRTNGGKQWSCYLNRWLTSRELLATMGVPVYPALAEKAGVPLIYVQAGAQAMKMLGNMFHVATAGSVLLSALVSASQA
jgi:site-specific DNA-cytosine methylase